MFVGHSSSGTWEKVKGHKGNGNWWSVFAWLLRFKHICQNLVKKQIRKFPEKRRKSTEKRRKSPESENPDFWDFHVIILYTKVFGYTIVFWGSELRRLPMLSKSFVSSSSTLAEGLSLMDKPVEEVAGKKFPLDGEEQALKARLEAWVSSPIKETRLYIIQYLIWLYSDLPTYAKVVPCRPWMLKSHFNPNKFLHPVLQSRCKRLKCRRPGFWLNSISGSCDRICVYSIWFVGFFFWGYSTDPRKVLKNEWFKWKSF